ncbi:MAG: hypothetical protein IKT58_02295 [Oscillospiraceae bacterium]|nr:hypothetical protein [Oscillospiraceae bacterium]
MGKTIRKMALLLALLLVLGVGAGAAETRAFSVDNKSGILLNFFNAGDECSWKWTTGNWSNWTGTATTGSGIMTANLDPTVEKICMSNGDLNHVLSETDVVEIRFKTDSLTSGSLSTADRFTVYCYTSVNGYTVSKSVRFHDTGIEYAPVGQYQTITLPAFLQNGTDFVEIAKGEVLNRITLCPYQEGTGDNKTITATMVIDYIYIGPAANAPSGWTEKSSDLFFDFTNDPDDQHRYSITTYNRTQFDASVSNWHAYGGSLTLSNEETRGDDGGFLADGILSVKSTGGKNYLSVQTGAKDTKGIQYTGNKSDQYAEIRVRANGFDGSKSGTLQICARTKDGASYEQVDGVDVRLKTTFSAADLKKGEYVVLRFTNPEELARWRQLECIYNICLILSYDGFTTSHSLDYDYIYIGDDKQQDHVMLDFEKDSPVNTVTHWTQRVTGSSINTVDDFGIGTEHSTMFGSVTLANSSSAWAAVTFENQLRYEVQPGDVMKIRVKLSQDPASTGTLEDMRVNLAAGGRGYWGTWKPTILKVKGTDLKIDGTFHEYTVSIPESSYIMGTPVRSLFFGFMGKDGYSIDFDVDYIYIGPEDQFTAYTGRSATVETPAPMDTDAETVDNELISFKLFNYNHRVNDNAPAGLAYGRTMENVFPFWNDYATDCGRNVFCDGTSRWNRFYEASGSTVSPALGTDGYPKVNLTRNYSSFNAVSLGHLFGKDYALGVHAYEPVNTPLQFDGEFYSYDSSLNEVDYNVETNKFYVRAEAGDGFTPFTYDEKLPDNWYGMTMELNFAQTYKNTVFELSSMDDAWVFIDGCLVLDLGGGNGLKTGSIDFATGKVTATGGSVTQTHTILQRYQDGAREAITAWDGDTYAEGTIHTLQLFFLERTTNGKLCRISFNLEPIATAVGHEFEQTLLFGQLHNHTTYSDGTGTTAQAYQHIHGVADMDYFLVTDHSNYFSTETGSKIKDYYNLSGLKKNSAGTMSLWEEQRAITEEYNAAYRNVTIAQGYEMTWKRVDPDHLKETGHMNVFNGYGTISRLTAGTETNSVKGDFSGMYYFYDMLVNAEKGVNEKGTAVSRTKYIQEAPVVAMWNHPSDYWGNFNSFAGYTESRDAVINLMEIRNGGATYEDRYNLALSKGWHIGPTAGQDHHGTDWGSVNGLRTVVRTDDFTEAGLYWALSRRHVYATVDQNFRIYYDMVVDGKTYQMGDIAQFGENATVTAILELFQPDGEAIGTVDIIGKNGAVVYSINITDSYAYLEIPMEAAEAYYYVRVKPADNQVAYTAPIWLEPCTEHEPVTDAPVAPTCTENGFTAGSHCSVCGAVLVQQEVIPATGHSYTYTGIDVLTHKVACALCDMEDVLSHTFVEGTCICGEPEVKEPILEASLKLSHSLNLASDISVNFVVLKSVLADFDLNTVYVESVIDVYEGNEKVGTKTVRIEPVDNGYYYYFTLNGLTAVQMNNRIQSVLYGTKEGQPYYSPVDDYAIADYAYSQLNKSNTTDKLRALCADLLRYGAKAQIYKNYRTDALADQLMTEAHRAYLSDAEAVTFGNVNEDLKDLADAPIAWAGKTLNLESKVCLKFVFKTTGYTGDLSDLSLRVSYEDRKGETKTIILTQMEVYSEAAQLYSFTVDALLAAELRSVVSVRIYAGDKPVSSTLRYSPDTYGNGKTGSLGELCKALFAYSDSAKGYFAG